MPLDRLEKATKSLGLVMNCSNTKFMTTNIPVALEESSLVSSFENQWERFTSHELDTLCTLDSNI